MFLASENIDFTGLSHVFLLGGGEACAFSSGASKPVSRVLSFKTAIYLDAPLPVRSSRLPGTAGPAYVSLHGVAPDRVYSDGLFPAVG